MPGQKISSLCPINNLQDFDQIPVSRGGTTYKITGDKIATKTQINALSAAVDVDIDGVNTRIDSLSAYADLKFATNVKVDSLSSTVDIVFATNARVDSLSSTVDARVVFLSGYIVGEHEY